MFDEDIIEDIVAESMSESELAEREARGEMTSDEATAERERREKNAHVGPGEPEEGDEGGGEVELEEKKKDK